MKIISAAIVALFATVAMANTTAPAAHTTAPAAAHTTTAPAPAPAATAADATAETHKEAKMEKKHDCSHMKGAAKTKCEASMKMKK